LRERKGPPPPIEKEERDIELRKKIRNNSLKMRKKC
jgi:hypothetical protein